MSEEEQEIKYQIIFNISSNINTSKNLNDFLLNKTNELDMNIEDKNIQINYNLVLSNNKKLFSYSLFFTDNENHNFKELEEELVKNSDVDCLIKLKDEVSLKELHNYYDDIFDLEMQLRETLFIILLNSFPLKKWYELLDDYDAKIYPPELKNITNDKDVFLQKRLLNELFFLGFSRYKNLENIRELKMDDLINIIVKTEDFQKLRTIISERGITKTDYQDFMAQIKPNLEVIEKFRNDIAHTRFIDRDKISNFDIAKHNLLGAIKDFKEKSGQANNSV